MIVCSNTLTLSAVSQVGKVVHYYTIDLVLYAILGVISVSFAHMCHKGPRRMIK